MEEIQVIVGEYENEVDANIAKGHLAASGIQSAIMKDDGGGMLPSLHLVVGVQLLVAKSQKAQALRILGPRPI